MYKLAAGFTLIEITIVLLIIGLILANLLVPLSTRIEQASRQQTQSQLTEVRQAIYGFIFKHQRLPCPDCATSAGNCASVGINDGQEDILSDTRCATEIGNLPWVVLGVSATDAWNNNFTYAVTGLFADQTDGATTGCPAGTQATLGVSFSLCSDGAITVRESAGGNILAADIPSIIVSHGANGHATSVDETANQDNDQTFVDTDYSQADATAFDDLLIWISPHILRAKMVRAEILP